MKLYSLFNENQMLLGEEVGSMPEAIERLLGVFSGMIDRDQIPQIQQNLLQREEHYPTFIIDGICIPHVRLEELDSFLVGLLVPEKPFPHIAEGQPDVSAMFMVLTPQSKNTMMLQTLSAVARLLKSKETRTALLQVKSPSRLIRFIEDSGIDVKKTLVAADIMTPLPATINQDAILNKAVDTLVEVPDEGVAVVDDQGRLVGELTSKELLTLGMPRYMDLLTNPMMLENFEPFENYFRQENVLRVRDLCRRDVIAVEPNMPIVQVTHIMMTKQRRRVYVVEDGTLKGIIYRKGIIAKVLHY
ncbi:PTS sugar transporter subunit IIA [bacterium]|nr:PTS sugar transporter subunit IIA [bacterium]